MLNLFKSKEFWQSFRTLPKYEKVRRQYMELYEKCNIVPMPILFSKLRQFSETGERGEYEEAFNQHIDRLTCCAFMALAYEDEEKYLLELEDCLYDVMSIYVWALSAHIPDINEENYYELDLVSCAVGSTVAVIYHLMRDRLHPQLQKRIITELKRRILDPFKSKIWHWEDRYNNWTSVCAGFTAITIIIAFPEEFDALLPRFDENMRKYYAGFPDDGVCLEGPGYWGYGFVSFLVYAILLKEYTGGKRDYFSLEKTKAIALFFQNTLLYEDVITSYGDCPMDVKTSSLLFHILKKEYGDEFYMPTEKRHSLPASPLISMLLYLEYYNPDARKDILPMGEWYMENAGWYLKRCNNYSFGAKGGTNGESHNHNDVASFIFAKDGRQVLIDMGGRPYTKDYFTDARYTYLEPSSRGHNVPIINGKEQANIRETRSYTSLEDGVFSVEYHELYDIKELKSITRSFKCEENKITVKDSFVIEGPCTFTERLVSFEKPIIEDGVVKFGDVRVIFNKAIARATYTEDVHFTTSENEPPQLKVYLTDITLLHTSGGEMEFTIIP